MESLTVIRSRFAERPTPYDNLGQIKRLQNPNAVAQIAHEQFILRGEPHAIAERVAYAGAHYHSAVESLLRVIDEPKLFPPTSVNIAAVHTVLKSLLKALDQFDSLHLTNYSEAEVMPRTVTMHPIIDAVEPLNSAYEAAAPGMRGAIEAFDAVPRKTALTPDFSRIALNVHQMLLDRNSASTDSCMRNLMPLEGYCSDLDEAITNLSTVRQYTEDLDTRAVLIDLEYTLLNIWRAAQVRSYVDAKRLLPLAKAQWRNRNFQDALEYSDEHFTQNQVNDLRTRMETYFVVNEGLDARRFKHFFNPERRSTDAFMNFYGGEKFRNGSAQRNVLENRIDELSPSQRAAQPSATRILFLRNTLEALTDATSSLLRLDLSNLPSKTILSETQSTLANALNTIRTHLSSFGTSAIEDHFSADEQVHDKNRPLHTSSEKFRWTPQIVRSPSISSGSNDGGSSASDVSSTVSSQQTSRSETQPKVDAALQFGMARSEMIGNALLGIPARIDAYTALANFQRSYAHEPAALNVELLTALVGHLAYDPELLAYTRAAVFYGPIEHALKLAQNDAFFVEQRALLLEQLLRVGAHWSDKPRKSMAPNFPQAAIAYRQLIDGSTASLATKRHLTLVAMGTLRDSAKMSSHAVFTGDDREHLIATACTENDRTYSRAIDNANPTLANINPVSPYSRHRFALDATIESAPERAIANQQAGDAEIFERQFQLFKRRLQAELA